MRAQVSIDRIIGATYIANSNATPTIAEDHMKYGARNKLTGRVTSVKTGDIMSLVKFEIVMPAQMASVLTTESLQEMELKQGDEVELIVKAIHVLPVKP